MSHDMATGSVDTGAITAIAIQAAQRAVEDAFKALGSGVPKSSKTAGMDSLVDGRGELSGVGGRTVSWADAVAAEVEDDVGSSAGGSDSSVEIVGVPVFGDGVRKISFGGLASVGGEGPSKSEPRSAKGYYAIIVRSAAALEFRKLVEKLCESKIPSGGRSDLGICRFTSGTMPSVAVDGDRRLRMLACVGDAAATLQLSINHWHRGKTVKDAQGARSALTSNAGFVSMAKRSGLLDLLSLPPGVDTTAKPVATMVEAVAGVLVLHCGPSVLYKFLVNIGFYDALRE